MRFDLQRFIVAQPRDYECALREIRNGQKQSHWVWYIFPQLKGFGHSYNSDYYGISDLEEARAYYEHPILGNRLIEITKVLLENKGKSAQEILSPIDARKVQSCMTLFWLASENPIFKTVIDVFYEGRVDNKTIKRCGLTINNYTQNATSMKYHCNPFRVDHLDFMIVDRGIRHSIKGHFTEDDGAVIALYNFFGRWFTKLFIINRIDYINEISHQEGRYIPAFMDEGNYLQKTYKELHDLLNIRCKAEDEDDNSQTISIDTEMILEINNLCHFNELQKMYGLFKKYLFTDRHSGNWGILLKTFKLQHLEGIPREMLVFYWEDDGVPHMLCLMSTSDNASYSVFDFDYSNTNANDFGNHRMGEYGSIQKDINIDKIINYTEHDYIPIFSVVGDTINCCNPPLIRHKYKLKPLRIPGTDFAFDREPEYFEKYYDLYHSGNWNAKHAIERGGFNLQG